MALLIEAKEKFNYLPLKSIHTVPTAESTKVREVDEWRSADMRGVIYICCRTEERAGHVEMK